jgi:hypothetical protein
VRHALLGATSASSQPTCSVQSPLIMDQGCCHPSLACALLHDGGRHMLPMRLTRGPCPAAGPNLLQNSPLSPRINLACMRQPPTKSSGVSQMTSCPWPCHQQQAERHQDASCVNTAMCVCAMQAAVPHSDPSTLCWPAHCCRLCPPTNVLDL